MDEVAKLKKFGEYVYSENERLIQQNILDKKIGNQLVSRRPGAGGKQLTFNGWSDEIKEMSQDFVERNEKGIWQCGYTCIVRVSLKDGTFHEDLGVGEGQSSNKAISIETAKKSAVTDARKRALKSFGSVLGNSLYDKKYLNNMNKVKPSEAVQSIEEIKSYSINSVNNTPLTCLPSPLKRPHLENVKSVKEEIPEMDSKKVKLEEDLSEIKDAIFDDEIDYFMSSISTQDLIRA